ncbi:axin-1-like [Anneissia japonica]|uniref:axin-1-like n=1 Tax=Anneissia japonica TaxID=1529436 RepID=UPI0014257856|nr:axin-1-like [Anneissia japonica]XP_033097476.1 axin-1-like [Anneissia japonica]
MSVEVERFLAESNFPEDLPTSLRPPVPGEENEADSQPGSLYSGSSKSNTSSKNSQGTCSSATPRKSNLLATAKMKNTTDEDAPLGFEPEGSDSITPPYTRWTESLHALLNDNDGISLFTQFLEQEKEEHYLKFWLACQGFKMRDEKTRYELSKLICKKFIKQNAQSAIKLSANTRTCIEDSLKKCQVSVDLFDQAQAEAESCIRENLYPVFLKSDIYVQYINNGGMSEKTSDCSSPSSNGIVSERYLPTLVEDEELGIIHSDIDDSELVSKPPTRLTAEYLQQTSRHRLLLGHNKRQRRDDHFYHNRGRQPINPYHASLATAAPAQSTNDSERQSLSSEAISDDTMSLTDSSIDGRPMYHRHNMKKTKRNMRRNIQVNGHIQTFPPLPCPRQPTKESRQLSPEEFVRQLTEKLERVKKDRETQERLQARLKEVDEVDGVISEDKILTGLKTFDEDPSSILDDHCARVFESRSLDQTPNRRSPGHITPKSKSPEQFHKQKLACNTGPISQVPTSAAASIKHSKVLTKTKTKDVTNTEISIPCPHCCYDREHCPQHGYEHRSQLYVFSLHGKNKIPDQIGTYPDDITHYYTSKSRPESTRLQQYSFTESRHKREKQSSKKSDISCATKTTDSGIYDGTSSLPSDGERNKAIVQWLAENESYRLKPAQKNAKRSVHKVSENQPNTYSHSQRHSNSAMSKKPVVYNAARPSVGHSTSKRSQWAGRPNHPFMQDMSMPLNTPPETGTVLEEARRRIHCDERHRKNQEVRRSKPQVSSFSGDEQVAHVSSTRTSTSKAKSNTSTNTTANKNLDTITVAYYFCHDPIPYRTTFPHGNVTLAQFKLLISRKGNYRYSFKTHSDEFDSGVVHEIISDDDAILPHFKGKIIGKVENIDS